VAHACAAELLYRRKVMRLLQGEGLLTDESRGRRRKAEAERGEVTRADAGAPSRAAQAEARDWSPRALCGDNAHHPPAPTWSGERSKRASSHPASKSAPQRRV